MLRFLLLPFVVVIPASASAAEAALPSQESVLEGLHRPHPRLLARAEDFGRLREVCEKHEEAGRWLGRLKSSAEKLLSTPPVKYEIPDGKRLLSVSRRAKDRLLLLGLVYRLTADRRFADRAWTELDAVVQFQDWNPSHFLDTAEMTFAVAIGYDWLHDAWTDKQRSQLRAAIVEMGLEPGLPFYRKRRWWSVAVHNWNQVCNGGMGVGALAIADAEPQLASEVLHAALHSLPLAMHEFRPDGGWGEGPGYWRYATEYNVYLLAALRTALGTDFGLAAMPGFSACGDFPLHFTGPTGRTFNFADAHDGWRGAPQLFWLATAFHQPAYAAAQKPYAASRTSPLDLLWGAEWLTREAEPVDLPLDRHFTGVSVATMRGAWDDTRTTFVGFKGGDNRVNHAHLDLGSFVIDAAGKRWVVNLGPDDYNIPGYFGRQRWTYYRNNTHGHNTLVIDNENQLPSARAPIVAFSSTPSWTGAIADLSAAWPRATRVHRGVALIDRRQVLVQDEIEANQPLEVAWQIHTPAEVNVDGNEARLTQGDDDMKVKILSPAEARFSVASVHVPPPQRPIHGIRRLTVVLPGTVKRTQLVIVFQPSGGHEVPKIRPLSDWPGKTLKGS